MTLGNIAERPLSHLNDIGKMYPTAWKQVNIMRGRRGRDLPKWPKWCFMPTAGWYDILSYEMMGGGPLPPTSGIAIGQLAALGTWRYSQGIYQFGPEFMDALHSTAIGGKIPVEVLLRLPEWCVYISTSSLDMVWCESKLHGFFAHLEWNPHTRGNALCLLVDAENVLTPIPIPLGPWSLSEGVRRTVDATVRNAQRHNACADDLIDLLPVMVANMQGLVSAVLYLCSDAPDFVDPTSPKARPRYAQPTKTKKGWRLFPPPKPRLWDVGSDIERKLSEAVGHDGQNYVHSAIDQIKRASPRAHVRRGHWHGFWRGPRKGSRRYIVKWLPPMVVAGGCDDDS
jgi:hypothetical protein